MDGAKRSKYQTIVVCGILLVLLGSGVTGLRFPFLQPLELVQRKCEICGKNATTTLKIGDVDHSLCEQHAEIGTSPSKNGSIPGPSQSDQSADGIAEDGMRMVDDIAVFGVSLTDVDIATIRAVVAELPDVSPSSPAAPSGTEQSDVAIQPSTKTVLSIRQQNEKEVLVYTGDLKGPVDGGGRTFRMQKDDDNWVVIKIGRWALRESAIQ